MVCERSFKWIDVKNLPSIMTIEVQKYGYYSNIRGAFRIDSTPSHCSNGQYYIAIDVYNGKILAT